MTTFEIIILCGGRSSEREVSLRSGQAVAKALPQARLVVLEDDTLPDWIKPHAHVVLPMMHGGWGEGGGLQAALEARGIHFAGSNAAASRLCMDKVATKARLHAAGLPVAAEVTFNADQPPLARAVIATLGKDLFIKPADQGSSVGLQHVSGEAELTQALTQLPTPGRWMVEPMLVGRELTVGLLQGRALGVVEIVAEGGVYDYRSKYTPGGSHHIAPAALAPATQVALVAAAEAAFAACGCRDVARVDVILASDQQFHLLEINTLPGMTELSLLPDSARCVGLDYVALAQALIQPALTRAAQS